ncbi:MAG TPA: ABC transporter ATP-binding protein [Acidimicrobiales bacterium]|nr:ABC transporter ATP-binding protein [Acidimicrobiales bacterium]
MVRADLRCRRTRHPSGNDGEGGGHLRRYRPTAARPAGPPRGSSGLASGLEAFALGRSFRGDRRLRLQPGTAARVVGFARPYRRSLALFLLVVAAGALGTAIGPLLLRDLIDSGIEDRRAGLVVALAAVMGGLALATSALQLVQDYIAARVSESIVYEMRAEMYRHIQRMPLAFFARTHTGALVSRLSSDVLGAETAFTDLLSNVVGNAITVVFALAVMATLSWPVSLAALVVLPVFGLVGRRVGRRLAALTKRRYELNASMVSTMTERFNVGGALLVRLFGRPDEECKQFEERAGALRNAGVRVALFGRSYSIVLMFGAVLGTVLIYGWGGDLAAHGALNIGTLVALVAYLGGIYGPLGALSGAASDVMTMLTSFSRVFELLDLQPAIAEPTAARPLRRGPSSVDFEQVCFSYPQAREVSLPSLEGVDQLDRSDSREVLRNVSFEARPGEMIALVGRSGAGKSTIGMLVPRIYDVTSGAVRIDGADVRELELQSLRAKVGVVTQEAHLFHDTLRANLLYARPGAGDDEILHALERAELRDVLAALPEGLDTIVGERGHRLSGGERQRVAIARLMLKEPDVVVLDEATAHLDSESEVKVQRALAQALAGRTAIVIAHRLSTVQLADQLLVIEEGRIVQRGTHAELLARGGLYNDLYRTQFSASERLQPTPP